MEPSYSDVQEFSVSLYHGREEGRVREIVRIDNSHDKGPHIHRLYRRDEAEEVVNMDVWEAAEHLQENWRRYARSALE